MARPWLFVFFFASALAAQISPGPLTRAHQQLEGVTKCASCHDFGAGRRTFRCLDCHTEIRRRIDLHAGFHARAYKPSPAQIDCVRCHMEHNGRNFALTRIDQTSFDHAAQTGFVLEGAHRQRKCEACHNEKKIDNGARSEIKVKDLSRTFLGLRRECLACHEDRHRGQLASDCLHCHGQQAWEPVAGFNHARSEFPLTGLHLTLPCQKCHAPRAGEEAPRFKGLAFSGCQSCHADPHRGAFQEARVRGSCETCHSTSGWKNNRPAATFRHDVTRFPLLGKHAGALCSACHKSSDFRKPVAHERCQDCHEDSHGGQFAKRPSGSDCGSCHNQTSFKPSRFDREAHQAGIFPLEGRHRPLACAKCHQPEGRGAVYITGKLACAECHEDRHGGQFAARPYANRCDACHTTDGFPPTTFSVERHEQTRFPLTGKHLTVACGDCHGTGSSRKYHFESLNCAACHKDPHQTKVSCETCHTTAQWRAAKPFDHSSTRFRLEGAHQNGKCVDCHAPTVKTAPDFSRATAQCSGCHKKADSHGGQFQTADRSEECSTCHITTVWKTTVFDHDRTRFPLDVAHRNVACAKCHKDRNMGLEAAVRSYRGTVTECVRCH